ncbi:MAG: hypothetical protein M3Y28_10225 [Armatimonadota bacterium]|nr:hypothetical protein [Armatimonadota bacterium]
MMAQPQVLEGTWEEIKSHEHELTGKHLQLTVLAEESRPAAVKPNEQMLAILREIAERQKDLPYTDGSDTIRLLREARAGAMYDLDPTDD